MKALVSLRITEVLDDMQLASIKKIRLYLNILINLIMITHFIYMNMALINQN
jgi:hypothetical protein